MYWLEKHSAWVAAAALLFATLVITWPLAAGLTSSFPGDYGDPVFVSWVMGWVNGQLSSGSLAGFWDANIFFPESRTLAFSEHFVGQALLVLPVHLATGNLILAYNVAFVLTFLLTGLGTFLFVRAMTGSYVAGALAACVAAFNEYRLVYEVAHLHTLSIHWFPFALLALYRYFETDRRRYLAGAAASLVALNLSSVYYMAYCAPLIAVFVLTEMLRTGRWRQLRVWLELWSTAAVVLVATMPFLLPYLEVQRRLGVERSIDEVMRFSATLDHYLVALPGLVAPLVVAAVAFVRPTVQMAAALMLLTLAFWLSLGPVVQLGGQPLDLPGLYAALYDYVPGYRGLRVPARFAMLFFFFLAVLAGFGVRVIEGRRPRLARVVAVIAATVFLIQASPDAFPLNRTLPSEGLVTPPPAYLEPSPSIPVIYRAVQSLRPGAILAELPFGDSWYDLRYMYFAATHRRRILNGYSGIFPPSFLARQRVLARPLLDPDASAQALSGATHIVVHGAAWKDNTGTVIGAWLESFGARVIAEAEGAVLYELPLREAIAKGSAQK